MTTGAARDPGLQPERTSLSWTRTAAALGINAVIDLRAGLSAQSTLLIVLSSVLLVGATAVFGIGRARQRRLLSDGMHEVVPHGPLCGVVGLVMLATLTGLLTVVSSIPLASAR